MEERSNTLFVDWKTEPVLQRARDWGINIENNHLRKFFVKIDGIDPEKPIFEKQKCYLWTGASANGYKGMSHGNWSINEGKGMSSSRVSYILAIGIPVDVQPKEEKCACGSDKRFGSCCRLQVRHMCKEINGQDTKGKCVNPLHLALGTSEDNQHDIRVHKTGRGKVSKGQTHPQAKMNDEKVAQIWTDMQEGKMTQRDIANKYEVTVVCIKDISRGKTWCHITGKDPTRFLEQRKQHKEQVYQQRKRQKVDLE